MRTLGLVVVATVAILGCKKHRPASDPPKPVDRSAAKAPPPQGPTSTLPTSCTLYIAAIERFKSCAGIDAGTRETFLEIFATDDEVLSGRRPAPSSALDTLCGARLQNVSSILESQCGGPLADRSVVQLQTELDRTQAAIAMATAVANDTNQTAELRAKAQANLDARRAEEKTIQALIADKNAAGAAGRVEGANLSEECKANPLAKGCGF